MARMLVQSELSSLYAPIGRELNRAYDQVNELWQDMLRLGNGNLERSPLPVGGKLLRPALCLLSAGAIGAKNLNSFVPMAIAMEMFHLAALTHDDVVDGAELRRGVTSLNAMWNDHAAVLGGDYLVARGMRLLASYNSCDAIANAIDGMRAMAEWELMDFALGPSHFTYEDCIELARAKTASLFSVACSTPSYVLDRQYRDSLHEFGLGLGSAFQLVDDLLDLTQDEATLGKPVCGDLTKGKKTLPILFMRQALGGEEVARLDNMRGKTLPDADRQWAMEILNSTGARERTESVARRFAQEACEALETLPPTPYKDSMRGLVEFVLTRGS